MPGTIQVSVLELMDLPPSKANTKVFSLKVVMGKREYQTAGKGDFSFPILSLRENLVVILQDEGGNVVSRTEFKTLSLVEKGILEDVFPLEGGGRARMKMQFSLSEEERGRIREVRDSALKRKHGELLPTDGLKGFIPEQKFGGLRQLPITELVPTRAAINNQLEQTGPINVENLSGTTSMQKLEEHTDDSFKQEAYLTEVPKVTIKISPPDDIHKEQLSLERSLDLHAGLYESSVSQKDKAEDQIHSHRRKNLLQRSVNSNVKKMISAFENSPTQEPGPHVTSRTKPQSSRIDIGSSLKSAPLEERDTKKMISKSLPKSFSAGMLSEINTPQKSKFSRSSVMKNTLNLDQDSRVGTMGQHSPLVNIKTHSNFKKMESSEQKAVNMNSFEGSSVDTLRIAWSQSHSFKGTEAALTPSEMDQSPPTVSPHTDFDASKEKIEVDASSQRNCSFHVDVASGKDDSMPSPHSGEKLEDLGTNSPIVETTQTGVGTSGHIVTSYIQLHYEENVELVHEETKNKERTLLDEGQQPSREKDEGPSFDAVEDDTLGRSFRSQSGDQSLCGSSNGTMELSTYSDYEKYPFQGLGIWKPRYLCITTGSKQLRNLVECCNVYVGTHPMASKLPNTEANEENKMVSSSSEKLNLENPVGIPKWNRGLVGQGVQILFIMVACGTLLFNTRQTKHR